MTLAGQAMVGLYGNARAAPMEPDFTTQRFLRDLRDTADAARRETPSPGGDGAADGRAASGEITPPGARGGGARRPTRRPS
jgi:hypothetical protein